MRRIQLNSVQLNAVTINSAGERWRGSHAGAPPVVPDIPDIPEVPEEPDVPSNPEVDENGYIIFADPEVARICAENWGDGTGITEAQVEAVDIIDTQFTQNTEITTFNELEKFTKLFAIVPSSSLGNYHGFNGCTSLQSIRIPNSVTELGRFAFTGCIELSSINLPTDLTFIGQQCFYNCKKITNEINLPKLATLSEGAFYGTAIERVISLGAVTIIPGSTNISYAAFANCKNLKSIGLLNKITEIGANAFNGCTSLEIDDLNLPNLETLGQNAFSGVKIKKISDLGKLTTLPTATTWTQNFGDKSVLEEIVLPDSLVTIPEFSFENNTMLAKCSIPTRVSTIGREAFQNVPISGDLYLPNLTSIGFGAFSGSSITKVLDLGSVANLGEYFTTGSYGTFGPCKNLRYVCLPSSLTSIYRRVFMGSTALETVVCKATIPPTLGYQVFASTNSTFVIYVPDEATEAYKGATGWIDYASRILPVSQLATNNPELYAEIEEYL